MKRRKIVKVKKEGIITEKTFLKVLLGIFVATEEMNYTANDFVNSAKLSKKNKIIWILASLFWATLASLILISIYFFSNSNTLFNVVALTEKVIISSYKNTQYPSWMLDNALIYNDCSLPSHIISGKLSINNTTSIEFLRIGSNKLQVTLDTDLDSVGEIQEFSEPLTDCVVIEFPIDEQKSYTMPIDGLINIGGEVRELTTRMPVLREGKILIADKALVSQEYYVAEPYELNIGDKFSIKDQSVQSSGFILIDDSPAMTITYVSKGSEGVIERYKTESILLKNSFWTKLYNDETLILLWILLGTLYTVIKVSIRFCIE